MKSTEIELPIPAERLITLQKADTVINKLRQQWDSKQIDNNIYLLEDNILK